MRRLCLAVVILAPLALSGCGDPPTHPDDSTAFDRSFAAHSAGRIAVGGQIREGPWKISFAGHTDLGTDGSMRGSFQAHFHHVSVPEFDRTKFVATEIMGLGFQPSDNPAACIARANWVMRGTIDGEPGYRVRVLTADAGKIGGDAFDDFRIVIYTDEEVPVPLYDSSGNNPTRPGGDFPAVSDCAGGARTEVDAGSVTIWLAD